MFRLLGILLGSAIAVAMLILLVGIPQISNEKDPAPVALQLPLKTEPLTPPATARTVPPETEPDMPAMPAAVATALPEEPDDEARESDIETPAEPVAEPVPATPLTASADLRWYAFWSPFRSQIAANGFVARLQRVTGLDYRVVSLKPGVYEVAFAYGDDDEIQANLAQISAATGLDLPES